MIEENKVHLFKKLVSKKHLYLTKKKQFLLKLKIESRFFFYRNCFIKIINYLTYLQDLPLL
jgi:hypothetical protein